MLLPDAAATPAISGKANRQNAWLGRRNVNANDFRRASQHWPPQHHSPLAAAPNFLALNGGFVHLPRSGRLPGGYFLWIPVRFCCYFLKEPANLPSSGWSNPFAR
ncbi:MAG: hypothetical protein ACO1RA_20265 [Planctomycetaceae bacterium]